MLLVVPAIEAAEGGGAVMVSGAKSQAQSSSSETASYMMLKE